MNRTVLLLPLLAALASAQDEAAPEGVRLLQKVVQANADKDVEALGAVTEQIVTFAKSAKSEAEVDPLASELAKSIKVVKGNDGVLRKLIAALGELRSKKGVSTLRKLAFQKKVEEDSEAEIQAAALTALGLMRDRKLLNGFEDQMKNRHLIVAKAAIEAMKSYAPAKGRVRQEVAEVLMKRLEGEYPSSSQASEEQSKRWEALSGSLVGSMQAICRQPTIVDVENWREWWRENKKDRDAWKDDEGA